MDPSARMLRLFAHGDRHLEFRSDGDSAFGGFRHWALVDDVFVDVGEARQRKLPPEVAAEAWKQIDALEIFSWRERYAAEDIGLRVADGGGWAVQFKSGARKKISGGHQAYPRLSQPGTTTIGFEFPAGPKIRTACDALFEILQRCEKDAHAAQPSRTPGLAVAEPNHDSVPPGLVVAARHP